MSIFEVKVRRIEVSEHPNADLLEIGRVDGYQFIVAKGQFRTGDLGVYIPEQAIVPEPLIKEMGLEGRLAGKEQNRVKAIKLRGVLSQGLFYRPAGGFEGFAEGQEVAEAFGITKWQPPVPLEMQGQVTPAPDGTIFRTYTDIDDIKKWPEIFQEGEEVIFTEKLHGTCMVLGILNGQAVVSSKGVSGRSLVLVESEANLYWRIARKFDLFEKLKAFMVASGLSQALLFGEGLGVQDLKYGLDKGRLGYRAFDLYTAEGFYLYDEFLKICADYAIEPVPVLYQGPFSSEALAEHTSGKSTLASHIREGVVIRPVAEREDPELGRVVLKSISPDYLTRKGEVTEFN
jgi:RNA ligase (TIGR02306 family)